MKETLMLTAVVTIAIGVVALGWLAFMECHRVFPWWYCLMWR